MRSVMSRAIHSTLWLLSLGIDITESFSSGRTLQLVQSDTSTTASFSIAEQFCNSRRKRGRWPLYAAYDFDDDEDDDDDDDDEVNLEALGDWRDFRRSLSMQQDSSVSQKDSRKSVSKENEELLKAQSETLAEEYISGVWAHETSVPEVGGLVLRMPLEVELFRNYRHSAMGSLLRKKYNVKSEAEPSSWYRKAQTMVEEQMLTIAEQAGDDGQIDATTLDNDDAEMLTLFLDNQETWQEVCLVLEKDEESGKATTLVLNRPMAMKLTDGLGQLVLNGAYESTRTASKEELSRFMEAFSDECAVYVGGPDEQEHPATIVHGIKDLPGSNEISPGSGIFRGGLGAAIEGVLDGKYAPLDFRFFIGRHSYDESTLDLSVVLGKYQPIACARSLALKQCISLPKPLWHEVLEVCEGELADISELEMLKRDDIKFQIVDEDDITDELDELYFEDDDE